MCVHVCVNVCTCVCTCVCMCVCACMHVCVSMFNYCMLEAVSVFIMYFVYHYIMLFQDTPSDHMTSHVPRISAAAEPESTNQRSPSHPPPPLQAPGDTTLVAARGGEEWVELAASSVRGEHMTGLSSN